MMTIAIYGKPTTYYGMFGNFMSIPNAISRSLPRIMTLNSLDSPI